MKSDILKLHTFLAALFLACPTIASSGPDVPRFVLPDGDLVVDRSIVPADIPDVVLPDGDVILQVASDLPDYIIPDGDALKEDVVQVREDRSSAPLEDIPDARDAEKDVLAFMRQSLTDRYSSPDQSAADLRRLEDLVTGNYLNDYEDISEDGPVKFQNTAFVPQPVKTTLPGYRQQASTSAATSVSSQGFTLTPDAVRAMSTMSREQIEAIALVMQFSQDPQSAKKELMRTMVSIPGLATGDLENTSPDDLLKMMSYSDPKQRVVDLGNGEDLALANWMAVTSPNGEVAIINPKLPGSRLVVEPGMIVGRFGMISGIAKDGPEIYVEFSSGDRITGTNPRYMAKEEGPEDRSRYAGEIIVSRAAMSPALMADIPKPDTVAEVDVESDLAPLKSIRPRPKPAQL